MKDPMGVWIATGALGRVRLLTVPNTCGDAGAAKGDQDQNLRQYSGLEGLFRSFSNRRQLAAYAGRRTTPWQKQIGRSRTGVSMALNAIYEGDVDFH